jgi:hypothetical protein
VVVRMCQARMCPNVLAEDAHPNRKYCSTTCSKRENQRRFRLRKMGLDPKDDVEAAKARDKPVYGKTGKPLTRRGPRYRQFVEAGYPLLIVKKEMTNTQVAKEMATDKVNVSRWMAAWMVDNAAVDREAKVERQVKARE